MARSHGTDSIEKKIDGARNRLLDLSLRNRLINFRPSARRSLRAVDKDLPRVYAELVLEERSLAFKAATRKMQAEADGADEQEDEQENLATPAEDSSDETRRRYRAALQTDVDRDALPSKLFRIANEANSVFEEQGYTVLYLAVGFLEWKDSATSETLRKAPLILIPVELERTKVRESYRLSWTKEDIGTNLSLLERLVEVGIALPEFEMPEEPKGIDAYFKKVRRAISKQDDWQVLNDIYLGFFSFTKFVMYKDLDPAEWPEGQAPAEHPLLRELFDPQQKDSDGMLFDEQEIDDSVDWKSTNQVMDADPSQIVAIEAVKAGRNLVVEGPPGTGKSQTIANVIAELLSAGKSVLFVSEKMAALEVVKQRLDAVGLGDFCLELHSRKARKKEVLSELERSLRSSSDCSRSAGDRLRQKLEVQIRDLNEYASQLREPFGGLGFSPFQLIEMRERALTHFESRDSEVPEASVSEDIEWTRDVFDQSISALEKCFDLRSLLRSDAIETWSNCNPGQLLPSDVEEIRELIERTRDRLDDFADRASALSSTLHLVPVVALSQTPRARDAFDLLSSAPELDPAALISPRWCEMNGEELEVLLGSLADAQKKRTEALRRFGEQALEANLEELPARLLEEGGSVFSILKKSYRQLVREIRTLYRVPPSFIYSQYRTDIECLQATQRALEALLDESDVFQQLFGTCWAGVDSSPEKLREIGSWALSFHRGIDEGMWTPDLRELIGSESAQLGEFLRDIQTLEKAGGEAQELLGTCTHQLGLSENHPFKSNEEEKLISGIVNRLENWLAHLSDLGLWARYAESRGQSPLPLLGEFVSLIENNEIEREEIEPLLAFLVAEGQLALAFKDRRALAGFVAKLHEDKIDKFRKLDSQIVKANQERINAQLHDRKPRLIGGVSPDSGMGILQREINKKKRHISIRKLMEVAGDIIQRAKPCFMMSPLSIAQFLDPRTTRFDVIVFDEASQVRPEDALGALLRGDQLVVMGDTKQLPPTSFFDRLVEDADDDEAVDSVGDIESILHLCRRSFPTKQLRWHYRSRHESLIEVSNHEFYDNSLVVYPSPMQSEEGLGLEFCHLPDTVYDRGKSSENREEARAVARAAIAHYKERPHLSLGVGAFSTKQQNAIQEETQRELEEHPEMEGHFSRSREEHFFVKNLETIQGDERDVILLSVGYGKDALGRLSKNFGPVNHDGGERRLNVLITRARHQCVVFSNFRADDLALDGGAARGVRALKTFLKYAESGTLEYPRAMARDTDSPFEDSVHEFLRSEGHEIHKQVGSAGYRLDLALCDPESPGRYLLGIECDGAKYHSSRVARERDRLRQQILEGLGWTIHRVWSTDWFVNRKMEQERLLKAVESAKCATKSKTIAVAKRSAAVPADVAPEEKKVEQHRTQPDAEVLLPTAPYEECTRLPISLRNDIPSTPRVDLAKAVSKVVKIEGPIHVDEVTRRIRSIWGLKRSGRLIQEAVGRGIKYAESTDQVTRRKSFLWPVEERPVVPRARSAREMLKIELICDEEIGAAIYRTLVMQYASPQDAIPTTAARLLGFQQTSEQIRKEILRVLRRQLKDGELVKKEDGRIDLANREGSS